MPQLFGDEVLRLLRQDPRALSHAVKAVAVSSEMDIVMAQRLLAEGFAAALAKPVQAATVLAAAGLRPPCEPIPAVEGGRLPESEPLDLDDEQARLALGSAHAVQRLRRMLAQELRVRQPELHVALAACDAQAIREWIHQLRASCALCGASRLDQLLCELRAAVLLGDWPLSATRTARISEHIQHLTILLEAPEPGP
jgi:CheY-like chemotaxis protein